MRALEAFKTGHGIEGRIRALEDLARQTVMASHISEKGGADAPPAVDAAIAIAIEAQLRTLADQALADVDAILQAQVAALATYRGRILSQKLGDVINLRDFSSDGAAADYSFEERDGSDNSAALAAAYAQASDGDVIMLGQGDRKLASKVTTTKAVSLMGDTSKGSRLIGPDNDMIDYQLGSMVREFGVRIENMAFFTGVNGGRCAVRMVGPVGTSGGNSPRLFMRNVEFYGVDRALTITNDGEFAWLKCIHLSSMSRSILENIWCYGKNDDMLAGIWPNPTTMLTLDGNGVFNEGCTGVTCTNFRGQFFKYGVDYSGQAEGFVLCGNSSLVAVHTGVLTQDMHAPANDLIITDSHISATHCCVDIGPVSGSELTSVPIAPVFGLLLHHNVFLPREEAAVTGFRYIRGYFRNSIIDTNVFLGTNINPRTLQHAGIEQLNDSGFNAFINNVGVDPGIFYLNNAPGVTYNSIVGNRCHENNENSVISVTDWDVSKRDFSANNAETGVIDITVATGTALGGGDDYIDLDVGDPDVSTIDNYYSGLWIGTTGGTGPGQLRMILAYDGLSGRATVHADFGTNPAAGTAFKIFHKQYSGLAVQTATAHQLWLPGGLAFEVATVAGPVDVYLQVTAGTKADNYASIGAKDAADNDLPVNLVDDLWRSGELLLTSKHAGWGTPAGTLSRVALDDASTPTQVLHVLQALITDLLDGKLPKI